MKSVVVGGGADGFMPAITAAEAGAEVTIMEKSRQFLAKVKISGGGRCNVTHACFDPRNDRWKLLFRGASHRRQQGG